MAETHTTFDVDGFLAASDLNSDHRSVVKRIFAVPSSENIEWRQVRSLLEALGAVTEEHDGKLKVTLGGEVEVFERPRGKDVDKQMIVDLRRMLSRANDVFVRPVQLPQREAVFGTLLSQDRAPGRAAVRYLGSTFVPEEEACFCRFEASDVEAVRKVNERSGLPLWRVVRAVFVEH